MSKIPPSFLSRHVRYIVWDLLTTDNESDDFIHEDCSKDRIRRILSEKVCDVELTSKEDYVFAIKGISPVAKHLHSKMTTNSNYDFSSLLKWLHPYGILHEELSMHKTCRSSMVFILKFTSILERALGDIYALSGKTCPFLLRDLVSAPELKSVIGPTNVKLLKICIGSPHGLNLRNLAWHGFLVPEDIPHVY